jgi:hypothetical protein
MTKLSDDPKERVDEEKCPADIALYGLHVLRVGGDKEWPEFTYSVGLFRTFGLAEVIILGLRGELAHSLLNELAACARAGKQYQVREMADGLLDGLQVTFRPIPSEHVVAHFGWALWYYDGEPFPALQLVFPSTAGVWPWDSEASDFVRTQQPILETAPLPEWARAAT